MINLFYKLKNDERLRNSLWMLVEKSISLFGLIFIISAVAKYTGPKIYGEISLAASIFIVLKTIAQLGLDQIYFKYVSQNKPYHNLFLNNSIQFVSFLYVILAVLIGIWSYNFSSNTGFWFILSTAIAYYFTAIDFANAFFEGRLLSKYNVFANIIGLVFALIIRYLIVFFKLNILFLTIPIVMMSLIPFVIKMMIYKNKYKKEFLSVKNNRSIKYYRFFLGVGFPLTLSVLTMTINGQMANFMLAYLIGLHSVGIYSIAFILAGAWCILPTTLIMSYMTTIYQLDKNKNDIYIEVSVRILRNILIISLIIVAFFWFLSPYIVYYLYGDAYADAISVLKILLIYQFFWVVNYYFSRLIIKFNGYHFLAYKSIMVVFINLFGLYFLINYFGVMGAAISILIAEFISSIIINSFYSKAKIKHILFGSIGVLLK